MLFPSGMRLLRRVAALKSILTLLRRCRRLDYICTGGAVRINTFGVAVGYTVGDSSVLRKSSTSTKLPVIRILGRLARKSRP